MNQEFFVWDARNDHVQGPYSESDAKQLSNDLNKMVHDNGLGKIFPNAEVKGPFYSRRSAMLPKAVRESIGR